MADMRSEQMNNMLDKISVVVPIYNQELYLEKSITGILCQTYTNLEVIAVNDGSTDKSDQILNDFAAKDTRLKIVTKENGGLIDALSAGVRHSNGKYITFVDPDDYIDENYIESLFALMDEKTDVAAAGIYAAEIDGDVVKQRRDIRLDEDKKYTGTDLDDLKKDFFWNREKATPKTPIFQSRCNKLYKKEIVDLIVDEYSKYKEAVVGEDTIFNYLVLINATSVVTQRKCLGYYYCLRTDESMTRDSDVEKRYLKNQKTFEAFTKILSAHGTELSLAYELYYMQIKTLLYQASFVSDKFTKLNKMLRSDINYRGAYDTLIKNAAGTARLSLYIHRFVELQIPTVLSLRIRNVRTILGKIKYRISNMRSIKVRKGI